MIKSRNKPKALFLIFSILISLVTPLFYPHTVVSASLTSISDTMTRMKTGVASSHTIQFTLGSSTALDAGETVAIDFDEDGSKFTVDGANDAEADYGFNDGTERTIVGVDGLCTDHTGVNDIAVEMNDTTGVVTFTACGTFTSSAANATVTIEIGTAAGGTNRITNPAAGTIVIDITAAGDTGSFGVDILSDEQVAVSASIDPAMDFAIAAKTSGTVNGEATSCLASGVTATAIAYGTLAANTPKVGCQTLTVTTNATGGFTVTIQQDQNLTSGSDDIDCFDDSTCATTPATWSSPAGTLDTEGTYGHFGFTSEDSDLNSDEFGSAKYAGLSGTTADEIFGHTGPADGTTADKGLTNVAFKVEIDALQEAGSYSNTLTYIATATF